MSNIAVRKDAPREVAPAAPMAHERDPFRMMRDFLRWDPFREMAPLWAGPDAMPSYMPAFEVKETKDAYELKADVPGVKEGDLEVTLTGHRLTVNGKRETGKEEKTDTYFVYERSYGSFTRAFTLPEGIDAGAIRADLKDGVLLVIVPKKPEAQPKKVAVNAPVTPAAKA